jgi:hypothetical protein
MLTSITPLGERGRNSNWALTVTAFAFGSLLGGALVGALAGGMGALAGAELPGGRIAAIGLAGAALLAVALDLGIAGLRLPTSGRQVNENWLGTYRGWVYGLGFGAQLGVGVATVVTSSAVYLTLAGEALAPSIAAGTVVGGVFGAIRGGSVLLARRIDSPARLVGFHGRLARLEGPTATATLTLQALAVVAALAVAA